LLDEAAFVSEDDGLGAIVNAELEKMRVTCVLTVAAPTIRIDPIFEPIAWGRAHVLVKAEPWSGFWQAPTLHFGFEDGATAAIFAEVALATNPRSGWRDEPGWDGVPDLPRISEWTRPSTRRSSRTPMSRSSVATSA
jgi:hypothetical protein